MDPPVAGSPSRLHFGYPGAQGNFHLSSPPLVAIKLGPRLLGPRPEYCLLVGRRFALLPSLRRSPQRVPIPHPRRHRPPLHRTRPPLHRTRPPLARPNPPAPRPPPPYHRPAPRTDDPQLHHHPPLRPLPLHLRCPRIHGCWRSRRQNPPPLLRWLERLVRRTPRRRSLQWLRVFRTPATQV